MKYKVGIICAGNTEISPVLSQITHKKIREKAMLEFCEGQIEGIDVAALACGACKVNAAIAAQILIDFFECTVVINGGTAGGMDKGVNIFDTVVSTETAYWDVSGDVLTEHHPNMESIYFQSDKELIDLAKRAAGGSSQRVFFGRTMTGEVFIDQNMREDINLAYEPLTVDMETAAIAHVCYVNEVPFIAIRTITDTEEQSGLAIFEQNYRRASELSAAFIREMLQQMKLVEGE